MDPITLYFVQFALNLVITAGLTLLSKALSSNKSSSSSGKELSISVGGTNPSSFIVGRFGTAGQLEYAGTWGNANQAPNAYFTQVISLSDLPITSLEELFVNGEKVNIDWLADEEDYGFPVTEFYKDGKDHLWIKFYDGNQIFADSFLTSKFSSDEDRPWTSDMIGRGVSYAIVTCLINEELFEDFPEFLFTVHGIPVYSAQKDSSVGGSGSHRIDDQGTWEFSDNPVDIVRTIMYGISFDGTLFFGPKNPISHFHFPSANVIEESEKCDELYEYVESEFSKKYRCGYEVQVSDDPISICENILTSASGRLSDNGGFYKITVGSPNSYVETVDYELDTDLTSSKKASFFKDRSQLYNTVFGEYIEPDLAWKLKSTSPEVDEDLKLKDGGEVSVDLSFPSVFFHPQAKLLMRSALKEYRRMNSHAFILPSRFLYLEALDVIKINSSLNSYSGKDFLITSLEDLPDSRIMISVIEVNSDDHEISFSDIVPNDVTPVTTVGVQPQEVFGFSVSKKIVIDSEGNERRPAIEVSWSSNSVLHDIVSVRITVKLAADDSFVWEGISSNPVSGSFVVSQNILPGETYKVSIKYIPGSDRPTIESDEEIITVDDVRLSYDDMDTKFNDLRRYVMEKARRVDEIADMLGVTIADQDASNYFALKVVNTDLDATATIVEAQEVTISELDDTVTALASDFTGVQATVGDVSAEGLFVVEAEAGGVDEVTLTLAGRLTSGGTVRSGALQILVTATGAETRLLTDNLIITNEAGTGGFFNFVPTVGLIIGT